MANNLFMHSHFVCTQFARRHRMNAADIEPPNKSDKKKQCIKFVATAFNNRVSIFYVIYSPFFCPSLHYPFNMCTAHNTLSHSQSERWVSHNVYSTTKCFNQTTLHHQMHKDNVCGALNPNSTLCSFFRSVFSTVVDGEQFSHHAKHISEM